MIHKAITATVAAFGTGITVALQGIIGGDSTVTLQLGMLGTLIVSSGTFFVTKYRVDQLEAKTKVLGDAAEVRQTQMFAEIKTITNTLTDITNDLAFEQGVRKGARDAALVNDSNNLKRRISDNG